MKAIGIDYGTSSSEVVYFDGQHHQFIKLDPDVQGTNKIRSSVFIYYKDELTLPPNTVIEAKVSQLQRMIHDQIEKAKQGYYEAINPHEQQIYSDKIDSLRAEFHNRIELQRRAIVLLLKDLTVQDCNDLVF